MHGMIDLNRADISQYSQLSNKDIYITDRNIIEIQFSMGIQHINIC